MKKNIWLCLILLVVLFSGTVVLSACKDENYKLSSLNDDFVKITENIENISMTDEGHIKFDYSIYKDSSGQTYLLDTINTTSPYKYLNDFYNPLFDNLMAFVYEYIEICSSDHLNVPTTLALEIQTKLLNFEKALSKTSANVDMVADILLFNSEDILNQTSLNRLKNLFDSYDELYISAFELSNALCEVYFDYAYLDSNPDYSQYDLSSFDANKPLMLLNSRTKQQISNLTQNYIEMNVKGGSLSKSFITSENDSFGALPSNYVEYTNSVDSINVPIETSLGNIINSIPEKENFYNESIEMYNIVSVLINDEQTYLKACNDIVYLEVKENSYPSDYESICLLIMDKRATILDQMNDVILKMISIVGKV